MKKLFTIFAFVIFGGLIMTSCGRTEYIDNTQQYQDNDTYSVAYDLKNVSFSYNANTGYTISRTFNNPLVESDVVLIYRQNGATTNGSPIWQSIPRTLYLTNGNEFDYDFDFSKYDILIKAGGNYDISTTPTYLNNQNFRVVIVPAATGRNANVDFSDYNAVVKFYNINESKIKTL